MSVLGKLTHFHRLPISQIQTILSFFLKDLSVAAEVDDNRTRTLLRLYFLYLLT